MGLDMYIFRVRKPVMDEGRVYSEDEARELADLIIPCDRMRPELHADLMPYTRTVTVRNSYDDMEKIGRDYGLSDVYLSACVGNRAMFNGLDKTGEKKSVTLTFEQIVANYTIEVEEPCYAASVTQEYYWRKAYDVQEFFYEHYPVENLGYYRLSMEFIRELNRKFNLNLPEDDPGEDAALFYHEWY